MSNSSIQNVNTAQILASQASLLVGKDAAGHLGNTPVHRVANPSKLLQDMEEELGAAQAERFDDKKVEDRKVESLASAHLREIMKKVAQAQKIQEGDAKHIDTLRDSLQKGEITTPQQLLEAMQKGNSSALGTFMALRHLLADFDKAGNKNMSSTVHHALESFTNSHYDFLVSAIHVAQKVQVAAPKMSRREEDLTCFYEKQVGQRVSTVDVIYGVLQHFGVQSFFQGADFLTQSLAVDISQRASSWVKDTLQNTLDCLKGLQIFHTIQDKAQAMVATARTSHAPAIESMNKDDIIATTFTVASQPKLYTSLLGIKISPYSDQGSILFLQDFKNTIKNIPDRYFASLTRKQQSVQVIQQDIDDKILGGANGNGT